MLISNVPLIHSPCCHDLLSLPFHTFNPFASMTGIIIFISSWLLMTQSRMNEWRDSSSSLLHSTVVDHHHPLENKWRVECPRFSPSNQTKKGLLVWQVSQELKNTKEGNRSTKIQGKVQMDFTGLARLQLQVNGTITHLRKEEDSLEEKKKVSNHFDSKKDWQLRQPQLGIIFSYDFSLFVSSSDRPFHPIQLLSFFVSLLPRQTVTNHGMRLTKETVFMVKEKLKETFVRFLWNQQTSAFTFRVVSCLWSSGSQQVDTIIIPQSFPPSSIHSNELKS